MEKVDLRDGEMPPSPFQWRQWLWDPWYVKAWWIGGGAFWIGVLIVILFSQVFVPDSIIIALLAAAFQPTVPIFYIIARAVWSRSMPWAEEYAVAEECEGSLYDGGGDCGFHKPVVDLANPFNPWSPLNPTNPGYIFRHKE